jgi:hypothetical protein
MGNRAYINELAETIYEIKELTERAKFLLNKSVDELFTYLPVNAVLPLKEPCDVQTWNKGYDFTVTGFKKRGDGCIMMCGTYCCKEDEEFLSYIWGYDSIKKLYEEIKHTFF